MSAVSLFDHLLINLVSVTSSREIILVYSYYFLLINKNVHVDRCVEKQQRIICVIFANRGYSPFARAPLYMQGMHEWNGDVFQVRPPKETIDRRAHHSSGQSRRTTVGELLTIVAGQNQPAPGRGHVRGPRKRFACMAFRRSARVGSRQPTQKHRWWPALKYRHHRSLGGPVQE